MSGNPGYFLTDLLIFIVEHWEAVKTFAPFVFAALFIAVGLRWLYNIQKETWVDEQRRLRLGATVCLAIGGSLTLIGTVLLSL